MFSLIGADIFEEYIYSFFVTVGKMFTLEWIFWGAVILEIAFILFFLIRSFFAYELRLFRCVDKLNLWLLIQGQIKEENLIEFNNKMKKVPKILRYQWQQYMLYRDKSPSYYMSVHNCVENPIKSSKLTTNIKSISAISTVIASIAFLFAAGALEPTLDDLVTVNVFALVFKAAIIPIIVIALNTFYTSLLKIRQSNIQIDLFETFHIFERLIDKASTTIPQYVDFEVLFTRTEIKKGIPVLNEYLEKRAREEEQELEKARINSVEHIEYNFEAVGMDGSLLLERAMRECEIYTNLRARLMLEIGQIESEIESYKKAYDNTQKDYQKKLQASKENIERLRSQQETTTNRIESNYIRKQQTDEIKKQQQVEKDFDDATIRYKQETSTISAEVEKRKRELEEKKLYIENVMLQEFKTYSGKVFSKMAEHAAEKSQKVVEDLQVVNKRITKDLEETTDSLIKKSSEAQIARGEAIRFSQALIQANEKIASILNRKNKGANVTQELVVPAENPAVTETPAENQTANEGYYDERGYYIFPNGTYYDDKGNFYDGSGGHYDATGNYFPAGPVVEEPAKVIEPIKPAKVDEKKAKEIEKAKQEDAKLEEEKRIADAKLEKEKLKADLIENAGKEGKYDDRGYFVYPDGSYYDNRGYFVYPDGTYYDDKGNFFDAEGGRYDSEGHYYAPEKAAGPVENVKPAETIKVVEPVQLATSKTIEPVAIEETQEELVSEEENDETDETETDENGEVVVQKPKGRGRPRKEATETAPVVEKPKGTRGRPKKETTEEKPVEEKPKGTRGRPRKEVTESAPVEEKPKGTRGRPRKNASDENSSSSNQTVEALKAEMERLANEVEELRKNGGSQEKIDELNKKLEEIVLQIETAENK